jgi:hypothetical protein
MGRFIPAVCFEPEGSNKNEGLNIRGNETTHFFPRFQYYFVPPELKPGFVRRILIVHLTAGNKNVTPINVLRDCKSDN